MHIKKDIVITLSYHNDESGEYYVVEGEPQKNHILISEGTSVTDALTNAIGAMQSLFGDDV